MAVGASAAQAGDDYGHNHDNDNDSDNYDDNDHNEEHDNDSDDIDNDDGAGTDSPVPPGQTVRPGLLGLTVGHLLAKTNVGLRHLDLLGGRHDVMTFSREINVICRAGFNVKLLKWS